MVSREVIAKMPKIELHVHLEGSIRPETVLKLARRGGITLPADTVEGLREWYRFRDFRHFVEVYVAVSKTIRTADDIELIAREFLDGQKEQNVLHSEVTYTASTIERFNGIAWQDQLDALNRAREYGERELGITMGLVVDIVRGDPPERGLQVAEWAVDAHGNGVCALGLAGEEKRGTSAVYRDAFALAQCNGLPIVPHAGETQGAWSIAECLRDTGASRIGHGVQCLEDPAVVEELRNDGITLELCPSSNVCLGVFPTMAAHPLPELLRQGLTLTINSDDPPMFGTTLTEEFVRVSETFGCDEAQLTEFVMNAARAAYVTPERRTELIEAIESATLERT